MTYHSKQVWEHFSKVIFWLIGHMAWNNVEPTNPDMKWILLWSNVEIMSKYIDFGVSSKYSDIQLKTTITNFYRVLKFYYKLHILLLVYTQW